jgi:hypothetical protein
MLSRFKKAFILKIFFVSMLLFILLQMNSIYTSVDLTLFKLESTRPTKQSSSKLITVPKKNIFKHDDQINYSTRYLMNLSSIRLNRLFDILSKKELESNNYLIQKKLGLISFKDLAYHKKVNNDYLKLSGDQIMATDKFIQYLYDISNLYSFQNPRNNINLSPFDDAKPVIVTAANQGIFKIIIIKNI